MKITTAYVRKIFDYDAVNGELLWRVRTGKKSKIGKPAGCKNPGRYVTITHFRKTLYVHRLVWLWHGRKLPALIDHINCDKHDNRIENLRAASPSQSQFNHRLKNTNTSGIKGVSWAKNNKKWQVRLGVNGKAMYFGLFDDLELAELVADEARRKYHGAFARHA